MVLHRFFVKYAGCLLDPAIRLGPHPHERNFSKGSKYRGYLAGGSPFCRHSIAGFNINYDISSDCPVASGKNVLINIISEGLSMSVLKMERRFNEAAGFTKDDDRLPKFI